MSRSWWLVAVAVVIAGVANASPRGTTDHATSTTTKRANHAKRTKHATKHRTKKRRASKRRASKLRAKHSRHAKRMSNERRARLARIRRAKHDKHRKRGKRSAKVPWKPNRHTLANTKNLPHGFSWPPTRTMRAAEKDCESKLDRAGIEWRRADTEGRIADPIVVPAMTFGGIKYSNKWNRKGPHRMDCQLALALETIGPRLHDLGVREVKFGSLFRWSNVRSGGVTRPYLSRHGLGIAMDVYSFVDQDGREAVVEHDYNMGDELLHAVEESVNSSGNFRTLLTPRNDPVSHYNHYHFEAKADYSAPELR